MREARRLLSAKCADKRRRVRDVDERMLALGLRMRARHNRLEALDATEFRTVLRERLVHVAAFERLQTLVAALNEHIAALEDAPAVAHTLDALAGGAEAGAEAARAAAAALATIRQQLADVAHAPVPEAAAALEHATTDTLHKRLDDMLEEPAFIDQFDVADLKRERARIEVEERARAHLAQSRLDAARVPAHAPSAAVQEREPLLAM